MNEDKMKFGKLGKFAIPCIDPQAPVFEILESLNKHGVTLGYIDQVFELVKQEAEKNTVVFSPTALWSLGKQDNSNEDYPPEFKKETKLGNIAREICDILARERIPASDVQQLCHILWKMVYRMSVVGR